ncbi:MAG TPA: hypothetical protein VHS59_01600 [Bacillota bacterium]|nr:hypothetical protein [Bacillota bacterium]
MYLNKLIPHSYLEKGGQRIPIKLKYYYQIQDKLVFLGEDNALYWSDYQAKDIRVLLKDTSIALSSDPKGDYAYALVKSGDLYRIKVTTASTEKIAVNVKNLYSAWGDWVVYQTADNQWWKQRVNQQPVQVGHQGSEVSPYVPEISPVSPSFGSNAPRDSLPSPPNGGGSGNSQESFGPWTIKLKWEFNQGIRHGGFNHYDYRQTYSWEYKDGISGTHQLYSSGSGSKDHQILYYDENNLFLLVHSWTWDSKLSQNHELTRIYKIGPTDSGNLETSHLIYETIYPNQQYYSTNYGIYILLEGKDTIDFFSFEGKLTPGIYKSKGELTYLQTSGDKIYFREAIQGNIGYCLLNTKNNTVEQTGEPENQASEDAEWGIAQAVESAIYRTPSSNEAPVKVAALEEDVTRGVTWLYAAGEVNGIYFKDKEFHFYRKGKDTIIPGLKGYTKENVFSLNGWIYVSNGAYYARFLPDQPQLVQKMSVPLQSHLFEGQSVVGFYQNFLCRYTWNTKKLDRLTKLTSGPYGSLTSTKDRYVYINTKQKTLEGVLKTGERRTTISGKQHLSATTKLWYQGGYIYFQNDRGLLYRVRPDGRSLARITSKACKPISFSQNKIYCQSSDGLVAVSASPGGKYVVIARATEFPDSLVYENVLLASRRLVCIAAKVQYNQGSDFAIDISQVAFSYNTSNQNKANLYAFYRETVDVPELPFNPINIPKLYKSYVPVLGPENIIDSFLYYWDANNNICRISLDGKINQYVQ